MFLFVELVQSLHHHISYRWLKFAKRCNKHNSLQTFSFWTDPQNSKGWKEPRLPQCPDLCCYTSVSAHQQFNPFSLRQLSELPERYPRKTASSNKRRHRVLRSKWRGQALTLPTPHWCLQILHWVLDSASNDFGTPGSFPNKKKWLFTILRWNHKCHLLNFTEMTV